MAKYYMVAFNDLDAVAAAGAHLGSAMYRTIQMQDDNIRPFPALQNDFASAVTDQDDPQPVPVIISGMTVGQFIGKYYDEWAVGVTSKPALIPANSIACIISTSDFDQLNVTSGPVLVRDLKLFQKGQQPVSRSVVKPVFMNDTPQEFALHILRASPFAKQDSAKLIDNRAFGPSLPEGYESPHFASLCRD